MNKILCTISFLTFFPFLTNAQLTIDWHLTFGGTQEDVIYDIKSTSDGGFITCGYTDSNDNDLMGNHSDNYDGFVAKIDTSGELEWTKLFGGIQYDALNHVELMPDEGYLVFGGTYSDNGDISQSKGGRDIWILKLNSNGDIEWDLSIGGSGTDSQSTIKKLQMETI